MASVRNAKNTKDQIAASQKVGEVDKALLALADETDGNVDP